MYREKLKHNLNLFDSSFNLNELYNYSSILSYLFSSPSIKLLHFLIELFGLGRTSLSNNKKYYHYIPLIWRLLLGLFLIYGWIHFCFLRPNINIVVQIPIYSTPIAAYLFGPYTVIWSEKHLVSSDITICGEEVLLESGWIFYVLPLCVTLYQLIAYFIFRHVTNSYHFYGSQAASYFPDESFFIVYYAIFWTISGLLIGFVVSNIIIWMKIHEKQLKVFRSYVVSNSQTNIQSDLNSPKPLFDVESALHLNNQSIIELRQSEFQMNNNNNINNNNNNGNNHNSMNRMKRINSRIDSNNEFEDQFPFLLRPEILMISHEIFRKSVMQSSKCCSLFTIFLTLFSTANYFLLLLVIRQDSKTLNYWTFVRVILWLILALMVLTSAARVTQSWHQMSITISSIKINNTSLLISSISSKIASERPSLSQFDYLELNKRQWDELIIYLDHVRYGTGYNYQIAAISITPSLIAKCCVALIYASYLILYGLG